MGIRRFILALCAAIVAGSYTAPAAHAAYPERPVRIFISYAAGGTSDIIARLLARALEKSLGGSFVVENRPGGNGIIAAEAVMQSPPDGHTLWLADNGHFAINPALLPKLPYDPLKSFVPITQVTRQDFYLVANKAFPANTVAEMVALAKTKSGGLSYGSVGSASVHNLGFERIKQHTGTNLVHIPYKGNAELKPALLTGDIDMTVSTITGVRGELEAGTLKALAYAGSTRNPATPNVPTFAEAGLGGIGIDISVGVFAPAGTPAPIVELLQREFAKALNDADLRKRNETFAFELIGSTSAEFVSKIQNDTQAYRKIVKDANLKTD